MISVRKRNLSGYRIQFFFVSLNPPVGTAFFEDFDGLVQIFLGFRKITFSFKQICIQGSFSFNLKKRFFKLRFTFITAHK